MIPTRLPLLSLAILGLVADFAPARANFLTNPSFEAVDASAPPFFVRSSSSTPGWTQFGDGVDLINNRYTQPQPIPVLVSGASDGQNYLDMNQAGSLGGIFQVVAATAGVAYRLDLDTCAWATNSRGGTIGYQLYDPTSSAVLAQGSFTDSVGGTWIDRTLVATATSSQIGVRIQGVLATQAGMGLDNVRLELANAVPEPSSFALCGIAGLSGLLAYAARRKRAA